MVSEQPRGPGRERLERFLAAATPVDALVAWIDLGAEEARPALVRARLRRIPHDLVALDELLAAQVDAILHHPQFQQLEAAWRGLRWLTEQVEDPERVRVRVLDASWRELVRDLERALDFDHSSLFRKVYSAEFGTAGGHPFGVLLGDYQVRHRPGPDWPFDDVGALRSLAGVAAAAFAPFVCAIHPAFLGLDAFAELERRVDFARVFQQVEYTQWNSLRAMEDSRFLGLLLPRVLLRRPWADSPEHAHGFRYREGASSARNRLFGNAIWAFGAVLVRAFGQSGWLAGIRGVERGVEGGGLVLGPVQESFATDSPGTAPKPITDVVITDDGEKGLADLGLIPLAHCHGTSLAAFYSIPSVKKPEVLSTPLATVNARLSTLLHYLLCVSRFAHYLKVLGRDKIGTFWTPEECERFLNDWLIEYTTSNEELSSELQAEYPLREAKAEVREIAGKPGVYRCVIHLRPHFQLDQMSSTVKLVTELASAGR
jgi:type VI secretion system ImpC/EvpB family protein